MNRRGLLSIFLFVSACGDADGRTTVGSAGSSSETGDGSTGEANDLPTFEGAIDAAAACEGDAASIVFEATRVGCVAPPPSPCTLPKIPDVYAGTVLSCPSDDAAAILRVGVDQTGRYWVEAVVVAADGSEGRTCYTTGSGTEVIVDEPQLASKPTIAVDPNAAPCG